MRNDTEGKFLPKVPFPSRRARFACGDRFGNSFNLGNVRGAPLVLLRPTADDGDIKIRKRASAWQGIGITGNVFLNKMPPVAPDALGVLPHTGRIAFRIGGKSFRIVVDFYDRIDLHRDEGPVTPQPATERLPDGGGRAPR